MSIRSKRFLIIFLAHYLFYRFYFTFVSTAVQQLLLFGFLGVYLFFHHGHIFSFVDRLGRYKTFFILTNIFYFMILAASFFIPILYKTYDFSYLSTHIRYLSYLVSYIVLLSMIQKYLKPENLKDEFMRIFIVTSRNYVIFSIIMLIIPQLKEFWQSIVFISDRNMELISTNPSYIARFGWAGYSGFAITFLCSLAVAFSIHLILKSIKEKGKIKTDLVMSLMFLIIGNSFYGRVGLMTSLALMGFAVLFILIKSSKVKFAMFLIGMVIGLFILFTILKETNETLNYWYGWILEPFINILTTGSLNTTSTDHLMSMYFLPDLPTFLFGDGLYTSPIDGNYYMSIDVGYLRPTLFYGIFFLISSYLVPVLLIMGTSLKNRSNRFLSFMLLFTLFVFEIKGEVYIPLISIAYVLFLAEMVTGKTVAKKNKFKILNDRQQSEHSLLTK